MSEPLSFLSEEGKAKWFTRSLAEQIGNIGSEVERVIKWQAKGNEPYAETAFYRALELWDLTKADPRWRGPKLRELCRLREVFCDAYHGAHQYNTGLDYFAKYCYQFALVANSRKL